MKTIKMTFKPCEWAGLVTGIFLFAAVSLFAAEPRLDCEVPAFDFGSTLDTQIVSHTFMLHNTGDATATITRVHSTCGCTTAQLNRTAVPPGETEPLTVCFNPKDRHGPQRRPVYVNWINSTGSQALRLLLTGTVVTNRTADSLSVDAGHVPLEPQTADFPSRGSLSGKSICALNDGLATLLQAVFSDRYKSFSVGNIDGIVKGAVS